MISAAFMMIYVAGFMTADILPAISWMCLCLSVSSSKFTISRSSRPKARITLTPVKFSLVRPKSLSRAACTFLNLGMVRPKSENTMMNKTGITTANMTAAFASTVNAMIRAPNTMIGERKNSRRKRLTAV